MHCAVHLVGGNISCHDTCPMLAHVPLLSLFLLLSSSCETVACSPAGINHMAVPGSVRQTADLVYNAILSSHQFVHREAWQLCQASPQLRQEVAPAVAGLWQQAEAGHPAVCGAVHGTDGHRLAVCCYPAGIGLEVTLEHWLQASIQLCIKQASFDERSRGRALLRAENVPTCKVLLSVKRNAAC